MTSFLRWTAPICVALLSFAVSSPAIATDLSDARDVANPERMTEPAAPGARSPQSPSDRKLTRPEASPPDNPAGAQPEPMHPDEGYHATVGDPAPPLQQPADTPQLEARPAIEEAAPRSEIDPSVAAEEKPGAAAELAGKPVKDAEEMAAVSNHQRGLSSVMSDIYTTTRVKMSLALDSRTPSIDINVDTTDGRVTLFGIVPSEEAKFAAGADALSIEGVKAVDNTLQVVAEEQKPDVLARDAEIQQNLEKNLEPYPFMRDVGIDVKNCVARLTGTVPAGKERDDAMLAVRKTPGVCQVKDDLRFAAS
jgi:hyperosmotically inducible protein